MLKPRSHAVSTERTILSPFTKEYRVLVAISGIRLFLEVFLSGNSYDLSTSFLIIILIKKEDNKWMFSIYYWI